MVASVAYFAVTLQILSAKFSFHTTDDFFRLLPERADSERSWTVERRDIEEKNYDLKAVNPNAKSDEDTRTPEELLDLIEVKGKEIAETIALLRRIPGQTKKQR